MARAGLLPLLFVCGLIFGSCATNDVPLPGKHSVQIKNLYAEYYNIAELYFSLEKYDKAALYYEYALNNRELYWTAYYKLAYCYALQSRWSDALPMYEVMLSRDEENSSLLESLGYIYAMCGQQKKSLDIYQSLFEKNPAVSDYQENSASILISSATDYDSLLLARNALLSLNEHFPDSQKIDALDKAFQKKVFEIYPEKEAVPELFAGSQIQAASADDDKEPSAG